MRRPVEPFGPDGPTLPPGSWRVETERTPGRNTRRTWTLRHEAMEVVVDVLRRGQLSECRALLEQFVGKRGRDG